MNYNIEKKQDGILCRECGTKNKEGSTYCLFCGNYLLANVKEDNNFDKPRKYSLMVFAVLFIFVVMATGIVGLYGFIGSLIVLFIYLIFGNSKIFKVLLYIIAGAIGLVILGALLFIAYIIVGIIIRLMTM